MGATDRITGKDLYVTFCGTAMSGDFTSVSFNEEGDLVDLTAAADAFHYYASLNCKDGECTLEAFYGGSATFVNVAVNTAGTLIIAPKGTAATNPKYTWSRAIVKSREQSLPYDDGVTISVTFQLSSAFAESAW